VAKLNQNQLYPTRGFIYISVSIETPRFGVPILLSFREMAGQRLKSTKDHALPEEAVVVIKLLPDGYKLLHLTREGLLNHFRTLND
jgi:hypothetical protein